MPIYEYLCADCGNKFEKLVRRSADADSLECPSCGQKHLQQELSTFSARANGASKSAEMPSCPERTLQQSRHVRHELSPLNRWGRSSTPDSPIGRTARRSHHLA